MSRSFAITGIIRGRRILTAASVPSGEHGDKCTARGRVRSPWFSFESLENLAMGLAERPRSTSVPRASPETRHAVLQLRELVGKVRGKRSRRVESTWRT